MSRQTLPLLFLNLSGEMIYIFDQRLRAQEIPEDRAKKAMQELLENILDENLTSELFKFQDMFTVKVHIFINSGAKYVSLPFKSHRLFPTIP